MHGRADGHMMDDKKVMDTPGLGIWTGMDVWCKTRGRTEGQISVLFLNFNICI